jgi:hypothetical protein
MMLPAFYPVTLKDCGLMMWCFTKNYTHDSYDHQNYLTQKLFYVINSGELKNIGYFSRYFTLEREMMDQALAS